MNVYTNYQGGGRARENVFDYNSDGIPDILVGCNNGWVYVFLGYTTSIGDGGSDPVDQVVSLDVLGSPTTGAFQLVVYGPGTQPVEVSIFDTAGRTVDRHSLTNGSHSFDFSGKPAGMYLVTATNGSSTVSNRLVIID